MHQIHKHIILVSADNMSNIKPINIKLDSETKEQFKTLAYIKDTNMQKLGVQLIKEAIAKHKDQIDQIQAIKNND